MILIGLSGKKHSGKDTVFKFIKAYCKNYTVERIAFADALKEEVALATGTTVDFIEKEKNVFRPILQWWGTDFCRNYRGPDYWIGKLLDKIARSDSDIIVVTDVRFKNEADALDKAGALLIRVNRFSDCTDKHDSETDLDNYQNFRRVITNEGTLDELNVKVKELVKYAVNQTQRIVWHTHQKIQQP